MIRLELTRLTPVGGATVAEARDCDKDGVIVAARIASCVGAVSPNRPVRIRVDRPTDERIVEDIAAALAGSYGLAAGSPLLDRRTLVLSSVHPAALYVAEVLHAPLLPLQWLSFSETLEQAAAPMRSIVGTDHDYDGLWSWHKPREASDLPAAYLQAMARAERLVVVRSTDSDEDAPVVGRWGHAHVNRTLERLRPARWNALRDMLVPADPAVQLRQWEWCLPDDTVAAARAVWRQLGRDDRSVHVVEASTTGLYRSIPRLWEAYLRWNRVAVRGVSINGYWTAHPAYERAAGLVPVHYYRFSAIADVARACLVAHADREATPERVCVFCNTVGHEGDPVEIQALLYELGLEERAWFSVGPDCSDAACFDVFGERVPRPFEAVGGWLMRAPYLLHGWRPLDLGSVLQLTSA